MNEKIDHILTREPEYLSAQEVLFSYGFLKITSIIMSPLIFILIIVILFKKLKNKRV